LAIAVTDIIVLDKRLQRNGSPHFSFWLVSFQFTLQSLDSCETIKYAVQYNEVILQILILTATTLIECGPCSNQNFLHHVWEHHSYLFSVP
jgi:hypothetical protein